jgi:hypothetical protein
VTGGWKKLHNLYSLQSIIKMTKKKSIQWAGHVAGMERTGMHIGYWWESQDNIKMDLKEIGQGGMYLINLAQDRVQWRALVDKVKNLWVPYNARKFLSICNWWPLKKGSAPWS